MELGELEQPIAKWVDEVLPHGTPAVHDCALRALEWSSNREEFLDECELALHGLMTECEIILNRVKAFRGERK